LTYDPTPENLPFDLDRDDGTSHYVLTLYVTGATPRSTRAINNIRAICDRYLAGRYQLEVVDVYQQPEVLREQQLVVAPTLIKTVPKPLKRLIGDLSDVDKVLVGLDLRRQEP
jgi:circadian clock protein KaiB